MVKLTAIDTAKTLAFIELARIYTPDHHHIFPILLRIA